jgi:tRNA dimethylallyltransferase
LAVRLAWRFGGEVISADSRQVYRGMDIGTGKITKSQMRGIAHYLLDVASPKSRFTVAQYKKLAQAAIKKIQRRGKIPIICGGTGFYIQTLVDDLKIPEIKPNWRLRQKMEKIITKNLYKELQKLDPRRAKSIDRHNRRRLIRALEIIKITGQPVPSLKTTPAQNVLFLGIKIAPKVLARRIKARLLKRLKQGMVAEVKKLRKRGISWKKLESFGLEYRWIAFYLQNKISRNEMVSRLQKEIERYAKRQMVWFKRDGRIHWTKKPPEAVKVVQRFLRLAP